MSRLHLALAVCVVFLASLVVVASASAYTFNMVIANTGWPAGEGARATAVCVSNGTLRGHTTKWYNENCQTHWYYTKLTSHVAIALDAQYWIDIYSNGTHVWASLDSQRYVHCDQWYSMPPGGGLPPAHWTTWSVGVYSARYKSKAVWLVNGPSNDDYTHSVTY